MALYTFFMGYDGGTYVSHVRASSPKAAVKNWARQLPVNRIHNFGPASKSRLALELDGESPVPLDHVSRTWCVTALLRGKLALINFVQTAES